ncbi:hypothetical protein EYF80_048555 [Liparis tanakae]|uniref:Uncharacterized protein n=1 Tax=Liparis tanakae TaxID=230148 RepID=A0A4Z2FJ97_9TELE|nr:hypothetical protein EYF80_048555 [Liparis tanakae]
MEFSGAGDESLRGTTRHFVERALLAAALSLRGYYTTALLPEPASNGGGEARVAGWQNPVEGFRDRNAVSSSPSSPSDLNLSAVPLALEVTDRWDQPEHHSPQPFTSRHPGKNI